jgi:O-antigen/teichoic acid export membrane protein
MNRTNRFVGGVVLGYTHGVLLTVVGLWMTPFLLSHLGSGTFGVWLVAQQLLGYLLLMDIGVTALLPRETAFATGRAGGIEAAADLPGVVASARQGVLWQLPLVMLATFLVWLWALERWTTVAGPMSLLLACFVVAYPTRLYQAFLQGVQELPFLSRTQIGAWAMSTVTTIALVVADYGLYALVIGWAVGQGAVGVSTALRAHVKYSHVWPRWGLRPGWLVVSPYLKRSAWISLAQIAQVFLTGSDLLLVGALLGAAAVVEYSCTGKLVMVLTHYPQIIMVSATPALSEMWAAGRRDALRETTTALTLLTLSVSGLIACLVIGLNAAFVNWWVGPQYYGGGSLTWLFAALLIVRHWNITLIYGLLAFGHERRISVTNMADGVVSISAGVLLISRLGSEGAVVGSLAGVLLVSLPANLLAVARATGSTPWRLTGDLWPWFSRFLAVVAGCAALSLQWPPPPRIGVLSMLAASIIVTYVAVVGHGLWRGPLGLYARPRIVRLLPSRFRPARIPSIQ